MSFLLNFHDRQHMHTQPWQYIKFLQCPLRRFEEYQEFCYNMHVSTETPLDSLLPPEEPGLSLESMLPSVESPTMGILPSILTQGEIMA